MKYYWFLGNSYYEAGENWLLKIKIRFRNLLIFTISFHPGCLFATVLRGIGIWTLIVDLYRNKE